MNEYELLYIVNGRRPADSMSEIIDWLAGVIGDAGGEVLSVDNWGRRRLAYPINHEFEGNYVFTTLSLPAEATGAVEAALTISEDVIRHLLIRGIIHSDGSSPPEFVGERPRAMQTPAPAPPAEAVAEAPGSGETLAEAAAGAAETTEPAEPPAEEAGAETSEATEPVETPAVEAAETVEASVEPATAAEPAAAAGTGEAERSDEGTEQQPAEPSPAATPSE